MLISPASQKNVRSQQHGYCGEVLLTMPKSSKNKEKNRISTVTATK
jgi:hypothetical protein